MSSKRQFELVQRATNHLMTAYRRAKQEHWTHEKYVNEYIQIINNPDLAKLPHSQKMVINGFSDALRQVIYNDHVRYMHHWKDQLYKDWNDLPEECKQLQRDGKIDISFHSDFYWIGSKDKF